MSTAEIQALSTRANRFAAELYRELTGEAGNVFFSPASVWVALAMTRAGARGETAAEMARTLHLPELEAEVLHGAVGALAEAIRAAPGVEISLANALFGQRRHPWLSEFLDLLGRHYDARLREVDFVKETEAARVTINDWVDEQTRGKIANLIAQGILTDLTRLVLVNAIYFKGTWAECFPERATRPQPFFRSHGGSTTVPLMRHKAEYKLVEVAAAQVLELPYEGEALSMVIVLPTDHDGLPACEARLGQELPSWTEALDRAWPREVEVYLPRFRVEASFRLDTVLEKLGMPTAFSESKADFSGMDGQQHLLIGAVVHKAFVEVNEEGTTAAAATAVIVKVRGAPAPAPIFRADHPFLFLIRDRRTGCVLFLGRVVEVK